MSLILAQSECLWYALHMQRLKEFNIFFFILSAKVSNIGESCL